MTVQTCAAGSLGFISRLSIALCCWNPGHLQRAPIYKKEVILLKLQYLQDLYSSYTISFLFPPPPPFFLVQACKMYQSYNLTHSSSSLHTQSSSYSALLLFLGSCIYTWLSSDYQNKFRCEFSDGHHRARETIIRSRNSLHTEQE